MAGRWRQRVRPGTRRFVRAGALRERGDGSACRADTADRARFSGGLLRASRTRFARICGNDAAGCAGRVWGRKAMSILPMACTGTAPSCRQSACSRRARSLRSSIAAWTLISSWAVSARSSSRKTPSVRTDEAIHTTGFSACARARKPYRLFAVSDSGMTGGAAGAGAGRGTSARDVVVFVMNAF